MTALRVLSSSLHVQVLLGIAPAPAGGPRGLGPPVEKLAALGKCMGRPVSCPSYAYPVGTVVFDANNHEAK